MIKIFHEYRIAFISQRAEDLEGDILGHVKCFVLFLLGYFRGNFVRNFASNVKGKTGHMNNQFCSVQFNNENSINIFKERH